MKPDVSAAMEQARAYAAAFARPRTTHAEGSAAYAALETAAEQACIAYAIQVVEGMRCTTGFGTPCIDALRLSTAGYCDRCTTLAQLREQEER